MKERKLLQQKAVRQDNLPDYRRFTTCRRQVFRWLVRRGPTACPVNLAGETKPFHVLGKDAGVEAVVANLPDELQALQFLTVVPREFFAVNHDREHGELADLLPAHERSPESRRLGFPLRLCGHTWAALGAQTGENDP